MAAVSRLTAELLAAVGTERKAVAEKRRHSRDWLDKIGRGDSRLSLPDAEWLAEELHGRLEFVRDDPVSAFRRALAANTDLSDDTREALWAIFERAKTAKLRGNVTAGRATARGRPRDRRQAVSS